MTCKHCGLPATGTFCCPACEVVYRTIHEAGLEAWYDRREALPLKPPVEYRSAAWLNGPQAAAPFLTPVPQGVQATLTLDGLHCAACCWLVEKAVGGLRGVAQARVNYATARLDVTWDPTCVGLGDIVARVASVGYQATPRGTAAPDDADRDLIMRLGVAGFAAGNIMLLSVALYAGALSETGWRGFFHWTCLVLSLPVVGYAAVPFWRGARSALRHRVVTMDLPIATGLLTTFGYSVWATVTDHPHVYFDTVAMFVFVLLIGRSMERSSQKRVVATVERLLSLGPRSARRREGDGWSEVDVLSLVPGNVVQVLAGDTVPVDGVIRYGQAWVDESMLTGESTPVARSVSFPVRAGTLCVDGTLEVTATRVGASTVMAQISKRVEQALSQRAPIERHADRAARIFLGAVLALAAVTFAWWHPDGLERACMVAATVLIVTCPCALGLATPLAMAAANGRGAGRGILFRGGDVVEALHRANHVVLDKTGTLTEGRLHIEAVFSDEPDRALALAGAIEQQSNHPLARAFQVPQSPKAVEVQTFPGLGVRGRVGEGLCTLGNESLMAMNGIALRWIESARQAEAAGQTVVWLAEDGRLLAGFALADTLRAEAPAIVAWLKAQGLGVTLCSGDRPGAVEQVARACGIDRWHASVTPAEKADLVQRLQAGGARVVMIGDGINDSVALGTANVGVAVANGTDLAQAAAGVVLLRGGLEPVRETIGLAHETFRTLRQNLAVGTVYNLVALPAAMAGWIVPPVAAVAMPVSSLLVVANSLRLWRTA